MKQEAKRIITALVVLISIMGCNEKDANNQEHKTQSLQMAFDGKFNIGAAINQMQITGTDSAGVRIIKSDFSTISPENDLKWMHIHPQSDTFYFDIADKFVALGEQNDMFIVGHTLVWHSQLAEWMNAVKDSSAMSEHLKNHINTIVGRYKGKIDGWDVVNEALNEDGSLRASIFQQILGDSYLEFAFKLAEQADPEVELYYNDYNLTFPEKRQGAIQLVKNLQDKGVKIDGIGMQGHWSLTDPPLEDIENSILSYSELGVKVMITELDITVLPNPWDLQGAEVDQNFEGSPFMDPYPEKLPDSVQLQLAQRYVDIFKIFDKHSDKISRVTFWGVSDGNSWLNDWPIKGRTNYPLLFDREYRPKMAYKEVLDLGFKEN